MSNDNNAIDIKSIIEPMVSIMLLGMVLKMLRGMITTVSPTRRGTLEEFRAQRSSPSTRRSSGDAYLTQETPPSQYVPIPEELDELFLTAKISIPEYYKRVHATPNVDPEELKQFDEWLIPILKDMHAWPVR